MTKRSDASGKTRPQRHRQLTVRRAWNTFGLPRSQGTARKRAPEARHVACPSATGSGYPAASEGRFAGRCAVAHLPAPRTGSICVCTPPPRGTAVKGAAMRDGRTHYSMSVANTKSSHAGFFVGRRVTRRRARRGTAWRVRVSFLETKKGKTGFWESVMERSSAMRGARVENGAARRSRLRLAVREKGTP